MSDVELVEYDVAGLKVRCVAGSWEDQLRARQGHERIVVSADPEPEKPSKKSGVKKAKSTDKTVEGN